MQIANINSFCLYQGNHVISKSFSAEKKSSLNQNTLAKDIPASVYKANFLPSFGKYKKVKDVFLLDKDTGFEKSASLYRDSIGDYVLYKLMVDKKEAGYLDMDCDAIFPENEFLSNEPDNKIPEVKHLRSIMGEKYYGIGTELVNAAVEESNKRGKFGSLWLKAEKGYARDISKYRSNENPIPFYYKLGFKSLDKSLDFFIKNCISAHKYESLPPSAVLLLSSADVDKFKEYYSTNYTYSAQSA